MDLSNLFRQVAWLWKWRHKHEDDGGLADLIERVTIIETEVDHQGNFAPGAHVHLRRASTQTIPDDTATALEVTGYHSGIDPQNFPTFTFPVDEVRVLIAGYYNMRVRFGWETYTGGGTVYVTRTRGGIEETVYPTLGEPNDWTSTRSQVFVDVAEAIPCERGDLLKAYVTQDSGSSQDLDRVELDVYLVDRTLGTVVAEVSPVDMALTFHDDVAGSLSPLTWPAPSSQAGDLLLLAVHGVADNATWATPSGWTLEETVANTSSRSYVWSKVADGTEDDVMQVTPSTSAKGIGIYLRIRSGVDYATFPPDVAAFVTATFDAPAVAPSHGAAEYLCFVTAGGSNFYGISGPDNFDTLVSLYDDNPAAGGDPVGLLSVNEVVTGGTVDPGPASFTHDAGSGRNQQVTTILVKVGDL